MSESQLSRLEQPVARPIGNLPVEIRGPEANALTPQGCCAQCETGKAPANNSVLVAPPEVEPTLVYGIGNLEAEFRTESEIVYWQRFGPQYPGPGGDPTPVLNPHEQGTIARVLLSDPRLIPGAKFIPRYLTWASNLNWYLRVKLPRKLLIKPDSDWREDKYRALALFLAPFSIPPFHIFRLFFRLRNPPPELFDCLLRCLLLESKDKRALSKEQLMEAIDRVEKESADKSPEDLRATIEEDDNEFVRTRLWGCLDSALRCYINAVVGPPPNFFEVYVALGGPGFLGPITVVDPEVETFSDLSPYEMWIDVVYRLPSWPTPEQASRLAWTFATILVDFATEGTNDRDRAVNCVITQAFRLIGAQAIADNGIWKLSSLSATPSQGRNAGQKIWQVDLTFVNTDRAFVPPLVIEFQVDVTGVKPTILLSYPRF